MPRASLSTLPMAPSPASSSSGCRLNFAAKINPANPPGHGHTESVVSPASIFFFSVGFQTAWRIATPLPAVLKILTQMAYAFFSSP
jgi:hypothetical protein